MYKVQSWEQNSKGEKETAQCRKNYTGKAVAIACSPPPLRLQQDNIIDKQGQPTMYLSQHARWTVHHWLYLHDNVSAELFPFHFVAFTPTFSVSAKSKHFYFYFSVLFWLLKPFHPCTSSATFLALLFSLRHVFQIPTKRAITLFFIFKDLKVKGYVITVFKICFSYIVFNSITFWMSTVHTLKMGR